MTLTSGCVLTIGTFDGVHIGHQALLKVVVAKALRLGVPSVVLSFEPQPAEFFLQDLAPCRLTKWREKYRLLQQTSIDYLYCLHFNATLAACTATDFMHKFIFTNLQPKIIVIGQDFRFGCQREGNLALLQQQAMVSGAEVYVCADKLIHQQRVSSTSIRHLLAANQLALAVQYLGHPYRISGRIMHGAGLGHTWGIPTANIDPGQIPLKGVYCVSLQRAYGAVLNGVANIGCRPTLNGSRWILEIHILNFTEMIYGERVDVIFLHYLRSEIKFNSVELLIKQIGIDRDNAIAYFALQSHKQDIKHHERL